MNLDTVPVSEWTDEEWLFAMRTYPPNADIRDIEREIAEQRLSTISEI